MSEPIERYASKEWADGEVITATKMNNISGSLHQIDSEIINARTKGKSANDTIGKRIDDLIVVSDSKPTSVNNTIWIKDTGNEVQIPTYSELNNLILCQNTQPTALENRLWIYENSEEKVEVPDMDDLNNLKNEINSNIENEVTNLNTNSFQSYGLLISNAERWEPFNADCDNLTPNRIYNITYSTGIAHLPYTNFAGYIFTFVGATNISTTAVQIAIKPTTTEIWKRVKWSGTWGEWTNNLEAVQSTVDNLYYTNDLWKVFHKVGIIGDSLASGGSASNESGTTTYHDLYPFSWGQCMARDSGNTYFNFSKNGLTTKTWMTDENYGYALALQPDKLCDAYIIGLGQNDAGQRMTVGSETDINFSNPDANANTFYGNYAKIIQKIQLLAPKAPIFVVPRPTVPATNAYEMAIRAMPTLFENVYLLDMYKHVNSYYPEDSIIRRCLRSEHYNAVGYQVMSKHIEEEISNVMRANLDKFLQVEFINTDRSWTN